MDPAIEGRVDQSFAPPSPPPPPLLSDDEDDRGAAEAEPIVVACELVVGLGDGGTGTLTISTEDDPLEIAGDFITEHGLPRKYLGGIVRELLRSLVASQKVTMQRQASELVKLKSALRRAASGKDAAADGAAGAAAGAGAGAGAGATDSAATAEAVARAEAAESQVAQLQAELAGARAAARDAERLAAKTTTKLKQRTAALVSAELDARRWKRKAQRTSEAAETYGAEVGGASRYSNGGGGGGGGGGSKWAVAQAAGAGAATAAPAQTPAPASAPPPVAAPAAVSSDPTSDVPKSAASPGSVGPPAESPPPLPSPDSSLGSTDPALARVRVMVDRAPFGFTLRTVQGNGARPSGAAIGRLLEGSPLEGTAAEPGMLVVSVNGMTTLKLPKAEVAEIMKVAADAIRRGDGPAELVLLRSRGSTRLGASPLGSSFTI